MTKKSQLFFILVLAMGFILSAPIARADIAPFPSVIHNPIPSSQISTTTFVIIEGIIAVAILVSVLVIIKIRRKNGGHK